MRDKQDETQINPNPDPATNNRCARATEFNFCIQQWNSMPNLVKTMVENGILPAFLLEKI
jgi:hypothetical protein